MFCIISLQLNNKVCIPPSKNLSMYHGKISSLCRYHTITRLFVILLFISKKKRFVICHLFTLMLMLNQEQLLVQPTTRFAQFCCCLRIFPQRPLSDSFYTQINFFLYSEMASHSQLSKYEYHSIYLDGNGNYHGH